MCVTCREMVLLPLGTKDWKVLRYTDRGPGNFYRYHVMGVLRRGAHGEGFARSPAVLCAPRHWTTVFAISPRLVALFAQFPTRTEAE